MLSRFFLTKDGTFVVGQSPNVSIIVFVILKIASLISHGSVSHGLNIAAGIALIIWSGLEITSGVNLFRRLLGGVCLILGIFSLQAH